MFFTAQTKHRILSFTNPNRDIKQIIFRRIKREPQTSVLEESADIKVGELGSRISKNEHLNAELGEPNTGPGGESSMCDTCAAHNPTKKRKKQRVDAMIASIISEYYFAC